VGAFGDCPGKDFSSMQVVVAPDVPELVMAALLPDIRQHVLQTDIPNVDGSQSGFKYHLSNIKLESMDIESVETDFKGDTPVKAVVKAKGKLDWKYELSSWPHLPKGSGSATVSLSNAKLAVHSAAAFDQCSRDSPPSNIDRVDVKIEKVDVNVSGGILTWLYSLIVGRLNGSIKGKIEESVASAVKDSMQKELETQWRTIPFEKDFEGHAKFSVLPAAPSEASRVGDRDVLRVRLDGAFLSENEECKALPRSSTMEGYDCESVLEDSVRSGRRLFVIFDDYVLTTALCSFYAEGVFRVTVDDKLVPKEYLTTEYFRFLAPPVFAKHPKNPVRYHVKAGPSTPTVHTQKQEQSVLSGQVLVDVEAEAEGAWVPLFSLEVSNSWMVTPKLDGMRMGADVSFKELSMKLASSEVGEFDVNSLQTLLQAIVVPVVLQEVNKFLDGGVQLPLPEGITLKDDQIEMGEGCWVVGTNAEYRKDSDTVIVV